MLPLFDVLNGSLVDLKPFALSDVNEKYVSWLNDPCVVKYSNQRFIKHTFSECRDYVSGFDFSTNLMIKIVRRKDEKTLGTMTAYAAVPHQTVDMGIMLGCRSSWGKGLGQDAWDTLLRWLLVDVGVRKVTAGTMCCNVAMVRIMERSGMSLEAIRPQQELLDGVPQDIAYFGKIREI